MQSLAFLGIIGLVIAVSWSGYGKRLALGLPLAFLIGVHVFRLPLELILHE